MLVQCPNCQTTYRVSETIVNKPKPTFRCSRCKNVFALGAKASEPNPAAPRVREESPELSFSFPSADVDEQSREDAVGSTPSTSNGPATAPDPTPPSTTIQPRDQDWSIAAEPGGAEVFTMKEEKSLAEMHNPIEQTFDFTSERPAVSKHEEVQPKAGAAASPSRPLSVKPYLLLCCALLLLFSALTLAHKARPAPLENALKNVPWIGASILKNDYLRLGIVLQAGRPRFQRILGNREVFMLSGVALNRNRVKVREVKIEAYVFGGDGKVIERQNITVGNAISAKIVRDLTVQEIATLQRQSPIRRFEVHPDESAPFSIVFMKSSAQIKSFGYRVVSADESL